MIADLYPPWSAVDVTDPVTWAVYAVFIGAFLYGVHRSRQDEDPGEVARWMGTGIRLAVLIPIADMTIHVFTNLPDASTVQGQADMNTMVIAWMLAVVFVNEAGRVTRNWLHRFGDFLSDNPEVSVWP